MKGNIMDDLVKQVVNAKTSWLRKSYKKARWKKRYTRWFRNDSEDELRCALWNYTKFKC